MSRALVMGLGRFGGGLGVCRWLLAEGYAVTVTDLAPAASLADSIAALEPAEREAITWRLGAHDEADFQAAELVVVNPAVPPTSRFIEHARAHGARITSEVELYLAAARDIHLVAITGTQGKSSTAHLTHGLLTTAGLDARLAGNIGRSLLQGLDAAAPRHVVAELSSYQLEALPPDTTPLAKVDVAIVTNLLSDHLARHGDVPSYHRAKLRILDLVRPGGLALLPASAALDALLTATQSARLDSGDLRCARFQDTPAVSAASYRIGTHAFEGPHGPLAPLADLALPGAHQRFNALAALAAARALTERPLALSALTGLAHRCEPLGRFGPADTLVIDNGVSTTPDSTLSAVLAAPGPVILLMGGQSKSMPLDELLAGAAPRLKRVLTFGAARDEFASAFIQAGVAAEGFVEVEAAVARAFEVAGAQDCVLFSPAAASFDAYRNFAERARAFRAALPPRRKTPIPL